MCGYKSNNIDIVKYMELTLGIDAAVSHLQGKVLECIAKFDKKDDGEAELLKAVKYINRIMKIKYQKKTESNKVSDNYIPVVNGIRKIHNIETYQCAYLCPNCGHDGRRFINGDINVIFCHRCNEGMNVYPATDNDAHDENFNYFVAY